MNKSEKEYNQPNLKPLYQRREKIEGEPRNYLSIDSISLSESQPRKHFDEDNLDGFIESIRVNGIMQNLVVRPIGDGRYELVAGERRYRAAKHLNMENVPVLIKELSDNEAWRYAIVENLQREDLNPVEEVEAIIKFLSLELNVSFDETKYLLELAKKYELGTKINRAIMNEERVEKMKSILNELGIKSLNSFVSNKLGLLNLPDNILSAVRSGKIDYSKAIIIARVKDVGVRDAILVEAIERLLTNKEISQLIKAGTKVAKRETPTAYINDFGDKLRASKLWEKDPASWLKIQKTLQKVEEMLNLT